MTGLAPVKRGGPRQTNPQTRSNATLTLQHNVCRLEHIHQEAVRTTSLEQCAWQIKRWTET